MTMETKADGQIPAGSAGGSSEGEGLGFERVAGKLEPEGARQAREGKAAEAAASLKPVKAVQISPALIRLPASMSGRMLAELTGFSGWAFTEEELKDLTELWGQVEMPMTPKTQAITATLIIVAMKVGAWFAWHKSGGRKVDKDGALTAVIPAPAAAPAPEPDPYPNARRIGEEEKK